MPPKKRKKTAAQKPTRKKKAPARNKPKAKAAPKKKAKAKPKALPKKKAKAKAAPKKAKAAAKKAKAAPKKPIKRRDATGHLDPNYERELLRRSRENQEHDDDRAFLVGKRRGDALAQELGREFVETVTSGEDEGVELRDRDVPEEVGGPFVRSTAGQEFADEPDASNPVDAEREPFPKT